MIKTILMAVALTLAASTTMAASSIQQLLDNTVQLNGSCSGTLVYSDRNKESGKVKTVILTAKHCVEDFGTEAGEVVVDFPKFQKNRLVKNDSYKGFVKGVYYKADLAIVELKDTETYFPKVTKIANDDVTLSIGDPVITIGYPLGLNLTVTEGLLGPYQTMDWPKNGTEYLRATPDITGGNSGGGMYKKIGEDYELLGVTTGGFKGLPYMALYTDMTKINEYLKVAVPELYTPKEEVKK